MIDFNSIKHASRMFQELVLTAIYNAIGMRRSRNAEAVTITRGQIVQVQSGGTRDVLWAASLGGPTRALGPFLVMHDQFDANQHGWGQGYGEAWIQMRLGLNVANVKAASVIYTSLVSGNGDIDPTPPALPVAINIDASMYVGTTLANSRIRCMILPLAAPGRPQ